MNRIVSLVGLVFLLVLGVNAQVSVKDPNAKKVLDAASEKFKTFKSFKSEFTQKIESKATGMNEEFTGVAIVKGAKFYLKTPEQEMFNDGKTVWVFYPDDEEVNIHNFDEEDDEMSVSKMLNMYKSGYKYHKLADETVDGKVLEVIDLEPDMSPEERKTNQVFKIRMKFDKKTKLVKSWKIFERNGNRYTMVINSFTPNVEVEDSVFEFDKTKHKGVIINDLR